MFSSINKDQIQILVVGMALRLEDPSKSKNKRKCATNGQTESNETSSKRAQQDDDLIFPLDEDHVIETNTPLASYSAHILKTRKASPILSVSALNIRQCYVSYVLLKLR